MPADQERAANEVRTTPRSTYRLQLHPGFGFDAAGMLAPYLADLGISHVYLSPYLQAAPGSTHGYDVVDHQTVSQELGGAEAHSRMCDAFRASGLSHVVDVVPNHMSIATDRNRWWWDILENGPSSLYARFFDVDWQAPDERQRNKVLMAILGDHYGRVLEAGEIRVERSGGNFHVRVGDRLLPAAPRSIDNLLARAADETGSEELAFLADAARSLPEASLTDAESVARRHRDKRTISALLARAFGADRALQAAVDRAVSALNADTDQLDVFLDRQNYRLAFWRAARQELDYRRFFDINELVALRMDHEPVFEATHGLLLKWVREGKVEGLRIDHIDGLRDPDRYLERLRSEARSAWIVAEKICEFDEEAPRRWPIEGTTGYELIAHTDGLFIDPDAAKPLGALYEDFTGEPSPDFASLAREKKRQVLRDSLGTDLQRLVNALRGVCEQHRRYRDYTNSELRDVLEALLVGLPVYRCYVRPGEPADAVDLDRIRTAVVYVRNRLTETDPRLFSFLEELLSGKYAGPAEFQFVARFQQLSGPATAKGVEDTALYCDQRLVCLNEVGCDPGRFGVRVDEFHRYCTRNQRHWPATMLSSSTHDTKRSEDVRLRIALISSHVEAWASAVKRWSELAARHKLGGLPDRATEYLAYQTLVGAWPIEPERLGGYLLKAAREAKLHTSWTRPDAAYERALEHFARAILNDRDLTAGIEEFVGGLEPEFHVHSLAHALLKLTAPGVPDVYQGNEVFHFALTDPDNRRPVDFEKRRELLTLVGTLDVKAIMRRAAEGLPKLWLVRQALGLRRRRPELFGREAAYEPLPLTGLHRDCVVAFARSRSAITVVPRLMAKVRGGWDNTMVDLPSGNYTNVLTGERLSGGPASIDRLLSAFPVTLLERDGS
jgi:(1->4)-alpha-D-glucan 1-alpha-D-glucosylmutase